MAYQPKSYKKFVATAATATLVASAVAPAASANVQTAAFTDVAPQYSDAIEWLVAEGYTSGVSETQYGTYQDVTRGDAAIILAQAAMLLDEEAPSAGFTDVPERGALYVNSLFAADVVNGKSATQFGFYDNITRGEMAIVIAEAFGLTGDASDLPFTDVNDRYAEAVAALYDNEITSGVSSTQFGTDDEITRGDFALFVYRAAMAVADPMVESLEFNAEGDMFTLEFNKLPEGADLDWVLENYEVLVNGEAPSAAVVDALNLSAEVDGTTITVSHTDLDDLRDALGGDSVELSIGGASDVYVFEEITDPMVESTEVLNATQIQVNFNSDIDADTLFANGVSGTFRTISGTTETVELTSLDGNAPGALTGELLDANTLVITSANALEDRYDFVVDGLETVDGVDVAKYEEMFDVDADTTAPTILSVTKPTAATVTVKFSEPLSTLGTVSFTDEDGATVANSAAGVSYSFSPGDDEVTFTLGTSVDADSEVTATFVAAKDEVNNLISPNPATATLYKGAPDGVDPSVTSLTAVNNRTVEVIFSEELASNPTVTGLTGTLTYTQDSDNKAKYTVQSDTAQSGLQTVGVSAGYTDLSGETGDAFSRVVNFDIDTVDPEVSSVEKVTIDGVEYLEIQFSEDVVTSGTLSTIEVTGDQLSNFVTEAITPVSVPVADFDQDSDDDSVYRISLADLLGSNDTEDAVYDLTLTGQTAASADVALVTDVSGNPGPDSLSAEFTRGEDSTPANSNRASLDTTYDTNGLDQNADQTVTVRFNGQLDGASATDVSNYTINGAVVENAVLRPYNSGTDTQDVVLTLEEGSSVFTGERNVTVSGVKALNGLTMNTVNTTEVFVENVAPTVTSARLTSPSVITVTFSEAVYNDADAAGDDFELYIGGTRTTATTLDTQDVTVGSADNTLTLTIGGTALDADDLNAGLSIKAVNSIDIKDVNGTVVNVDSVTVQQ